jgi:hypothetical protein
VLLPLSIIDVLLLVKCAVLRVPAKRFGRRGDQDVVPGDALCLDAFHIRHRERVAGCPRVVIADECGAWQKNGQGGSGHPNAQTDYRPVRFLEEPIRRQQCSRQQQETSAESPPGRKTRVAASIQKRRTSASSSRERRTTGSPSQSPAPAWRPAPEGRSIHT